TIVVEDPKDLRRVVKKINHCSLLGFDTETRPSFKKGRINKVALLQLSGGGITYLFRLNKIGLPVEIINILSNPKIIKIGVAIHDDLISLRKLKEFKPDGFIELQDMVKEFGIENFSLKNLCAIVLGFKISKAKQLSNWEQDKLDDAQIKYAATDAWASVEIYKELINNNEGAD
ncbi:3'-5' exonuclease, partial [Bacteroidota bacterium]